MPTGVGVGVGVCKILQRKSFYIEADDWNTLEYYTFHSIVVIPSSLFPLHCSAFFFLLVVDANNRVINNILCTCILNRKVYNSYPCRACFFYS